MDHIHLAYDLIDHIHLAYDQNELHAKALPVTRFGSS